MTGGIAKFSFQPTPKSRMSMHWFFCCFVALSFAVRSDCLLYVSRGSKILGESEAAYGFGCDDGYGYEHAKQDGSDGYRGGDAAVYASIYSFSN